MNGFFSCITALELIIVNPGCFICHRFKWHQHILINVHIDASLLICRKCITNIIKIRRQSVIHSQRIILSKIRIHTSLRRQLGILVCIISPY